MCVRELDRKERKLLKLSVEERKKRTEEKRERKGKKKKNTEAYKERKQNIDCLIHLWRSKSIQYTLDTDMG